MNQFLSKLRQFTQARIQLAHAGHTLATHEVLKLKLANAQAQDVIYKKWDYTSLHDNLIAHDNTVLVAKSKTSSKKEFLLRPDLGKQLTSNSKALLKRLTHQSYDIVCIVSDGLSSVAIDKHFSKLWSLLRKKFNRWPYKIAPLVLVPFGRVAISDQVGFYLGCKIAIIFIGERPGSTATDSLGIYLTYHPKLDNHDSARNCISNIRPPEGTNYQKAIVLLKKLIWKSMQQKVSGTSLLLR